MAVGIHPAMGRLTYRRALLAHAEAREALAEAALERARAKGIHPRQRYVDAYSKAKALSRHRRDLVHQAEAVQPDRTTTFDGTPVFQGLAAMLTECRKHGWTGTLSSADRRKGVAERYGRMSQAALYAGWIAHRAGFNPANPPGRSTHELRSDGVPYAGPVGRPLAWWQLGMDVTDSDGLLRVANARGYALFRPYPSGSEAHHVNLRRPPR